jgi:lysophospholipase L1-like esterase
MSRRVPALSLLLSFLLGFGSLTEARGDALAVAFSPVPIEDEGGHALSSFYSALRRAKEAKGQARVVFYGDSHTAPDVITGRLRQAWQGAFGDAGIGFVMPGKPWPHHHHMLVEYGESRGLIGQRIKRTVRSGRFGLFGASLKAKKGASVRMRTRGYAKSSGHASELELYYLKQPGGGRFTLLLDDKPAQIISTKGRAFGTGYTQVSLRDGPHSIVLRGFEGQVTLLGMTLERKRPGVIVDTLGIPGARAKFHLLWDEALYSEQLKKRAADLIVLSYGTNEAGDEDLSLSDYESSLRLVLQRMKTLAPQASCLLLGPTDRPERLEDGSFLVRTQLEAVQALQRKLAKEHGCGFFDVVAAMGGPLSIIRLANADPPFAARDYVHLTMRGYEALGDALYAALMRDYRDK